MITKRIKIDKILLLLLIPRLISAIIFHISGHIGFGGDPHAYIYLGESIINPIQSELPTVESSNYWLYINQFRQGINFSSLIQSFPNNVYGVVFLHAASKYIFNSMFYVLVLQVFLNVIAYRSLIKNLHIQGGLKWILIFNPVSIYFVATHFKESLLESFIILFFVYTFLKGKNKKALFFSILAGFIRFEVAIILWGMFFLQIKQVRRFFRLNPVKFFLLVVFFCFLFIDQTATYSQVGSYQGGIFYSILFYNEVTNKLLSGIYGFLNPVPFSMPISQSSGFYFFFYSFLNLFVIYTFIKRYVGKYVKNKDIYVYANYFLMVIVVVSYYFSGVLGVVDRYKYPFVVVLLISMYYDKVLLFKKKQTLKSII